MTVSTVSNRVKTFGKRKNILGYSILILLFIIHPGCKKDDVKVIPPSYQTVNLVSDTAGYNAVTIDPNLTNAWGMAISPSGGFWISSAGKGLSTIYNRTGMTILAPVSIPSNNMHNGGKPTGVVYNSTNDFVISANGETSRFIYAGENGTIHAWSSGDSTHTVSDRSSSNAVYKGIAIATVNTTNYLYVANFKGRSIDVFDCNFNLTSIFTSTAFQDPTMPLSFAPFNIQNIGGYLYVTYAKLKAPDNTDDEKGLGNGYINVFNPSGVLIKHFATQGTLNSPWGLAQVPAGFGQVSSAILVGNFGDGKINVYDAAGTYQGQLNDGGTPIVIDGLWALAFPQNGIPAGDQNQLFFTAGGHNENRGVFGYVKLR